MMEKKERLLPIKEVFFTYLAISKIMYWINVVAALDQSDFRSVMTAVAARLLNQDVMIIASVILFFALEKLILKKSKGHGILKQVILYAAGFVGMVMLFYVYSWILSWFYEITIPPLGLFVSNFIFGYIAAMVALNVKFYFKAKEKETFAPPAKKDDKLAMLKTLLDNGVLTQDEFDLKKAKVLSM